MANTWPEFLVYPHHVPQWCHSRLLFCFRSSFFLAIRPEIQHQADFPSMFSCNHFSEAVGQRKIQQEGRFNQPRRSISWIRCFPIFLGPLKSSLSWSFGSPTQEIALTGDPPNKIQTFLHNHAMAQLGSCFQSPTKNVWFFIAMVYIHIMTIDWINMT